MRWSKYRAPTAGITGAPMQRPIPMRLLRMAPIFPILRRRGPLAIVGLSTACPSPPRVRDRAARHGPAGALDALLERLREERRCRVVLLHHSPARRPRPAATATARRRGAAWLRRAPWRRSDPARPRAPVQLRSDRRPRRPRSGVRHAVGIEAVASRGTRGPVPHVWDRVERRRWRIVTESRLFSMASGNFMTGARHVVVAAGRCPQPAPGTRPRDMPKIGLISNPQSQRNRRGLDEIGAAIAGVPDLIHIATDGREQPRSKILAELARQEVGVLRDQRRRRHGADGADAAVRGYGRSSACRIWPFCRAGWPTRPRRRRPARPARARRSAASDRGQSATGEIAEHVVGRHDPAGREHPGAAPQRGMMFGAGAITMRSSSAAARSMRAV